MWGCRATTKTAELTAGLKTNRCVCWQLLQSSASTMPYLPDKQIFFFSWGWQIKSATEVGCNVQAPCFPEHTSAAVNPGSVSDICAHLALFLSPLQWIFFLKLIGSRQKNASPWLQNSTEQLILSVQNHCWWTSHIPVSLSAGRGSNEVTTTALVYQPGFCF